MRTPFILAIATCLLASSFAQAGVIKVPGDEPTIQDAVDAASNGDVIKIGKGRWQESINTSKELTFVGKKGTIWDGYFGGSHKDQLIATADNVMVKGIEFQNGSRPIQITGDDAKVSNCKFRGSEEGVWVDGPRAKVLDNTFNGLTGSDFTIEIYGQDAKIEDNKLLYNNYAGIYVDAENNGTARVIDNVMDSSQDLMSIDVNNATAPKIQKNKLQFGYMNGTVLNVTNCDNADISGNKLLTINYNVEYGIYASGTGVTIYKNVIDNLNYYDSDLYAIYVTGNNAMVKKNKIRACGSGDEADTYGIYADGAMCTVDGNVITDLGGGGDDIYGIYADGNDCTVTKNRLDRLNDEYTYVIYHDGDRAKVTKNRISNTMDGEAIYVSGDDFVIASNTIKGGAYDCQPIETSGSATGAGLARIENNYASNIGWDGFYMVGNGVIIKNNRCKYIQGQGFYVSGNNNTLVGNTAMYCADDGFYITGDNNTLTKCVAKDSERDGFDINGNGNTLNKCKAFDCVAEGLDNGGTATTATNCTLRGSRIDYAGNNNMASDAGTVYTTGGPLEVPQID